MLFRSRRYEEVLTADWLKDGDVTLGLTAGASTPDSVVGEVLDRILALRGLTADDLQPTALCEEGR